MLPATTALETQPLTLTCPLYQPEKLQADYSWEAGKNEIIAIVMVVAIVALAIFGLYYVCLESIDLLPYFFISTGYLLTVLHSNFYAPYKEAGIEFREKADFESRVITKMSEYNTWTEQALQELHRGCGALPLSETAKRALGENPHHRLTAMYARHAVCQDHINSRLQAIQKFFMQPPEDERRRNFFSIMAERNNTNNTEEDMLRLEGEASMYLGLRFRNELEIKKFMLQQAFTTYVLSNPFHHGQYDRIVKEADTPVIMRVMQDRYGADRLCTFLADSSDLASNRFDLKQAEAISMITAIALEHLREQSPESYRSRDAPFRTFIAGLRSDENLQTIKNKISPFSEDWDKIASVVAEKIQRHISNRTMPFEFKRVLEELLFEPEMQRILGTYRNHHFNLVFHQHDAQHKIVAEIIRQREETDITAGDTPLTRAEVGYVNSKRGVEPEVLEKDPIITSMANRIALRAAS